VGYGTGRIGEGTKTVETVRGDSIISREGLESPDVVKIDVEGAEGLVIAGMSNSLSRCRRIYCEIHIGNKEKK
jgi:FkbM family methyltransferase